MTTILKRSIVGALLFFAVEFGNQPTGAGILDVFKSDGKKNDEWYAANRQNITAQFTSLGYITSTNPNWTTNRDGQPERMQALAGLVENKSDQQVSAVLFDIIVSQPGTGLEALRERVWLDVTVFKTEKANFTNALPSMSKGSSQIFECLDRNTNYNWHAEIVTAIPQSTADEVMKSMALRDYYKVKSSWYSTK